MKLFEEKYSKTLAIIKNYIKKMIIEKENWESKENKNNTHIFTAFRFSTTYFRS